MVYTAEKTHEGKRLDAYLSEVSDMSRSAAAKLIESGDCLVNGKACVKKYCIKDGDIITVNEPEPEDLSVAAEDIALDIVYEDNDILVINKKSGMVVHPAPGNYTGTLVNAIMYHCKDSLSGIGGVLRPGIVHRIDKDTSGLLVVAKNDNAHRILSSALEKHEIVREYHALVRGGFKEETGVVDLPIGRHPVDRKRMAVLTSPTAHSKSAVTHYEVIESYGQITYLKLVLETGRTHQIRVHMAHLGHPLLGDTVYGGGKTQFEKQHPALFDGQALHAKKLTLTHPVTGEKMEFESPLPENFEKMLYILRGDFS